jgi:O-antigen ligase
VALHALLAGAGPVLIRLVAVVGAVLGGALAAAGSPVALAGLLSLCFLGLALVDLARAIAVWAALLFLIGFPGVYTGEFVAAAIIFLAWLGTIAARGSESLAALRRHKGILFLIAALLIWLVLSVAWVDSMTLAGEGLWLWVVPMLMAPVVATTLNTPSKIRAVVFGLTFGGLVSLAVGAFAPHIAEPTPWIKEHTLQTGRLYGASTDPNLLAAGLLPAIILVAALISGVRRRGRRLMLLAVIATMLVGVAATASRGAILASAVAVVAAVALLRGRRKPALAVAGLCVTLVAVGFLLLPAALQRIETADDKGGRDALWTSAARMALDHPLIGVGIGNYVHHSPDYARGPGALEQVGLVAEERTYAHNVYLQLAAETGFIGLALYLALLAAFLAAAWRAARRFDDRGDRRFATFCRAVMVGTLAMMTMAVFHWWVDPRLWLLLGLSIALLELSTREPEVAVGPPHEAGYPAGARGGAAGGTPTLVTGRPDPRTV